MVREKNKNDLFNDDFGFLKKTNAPMKMAKTKEIKCIWATNFISGLRSRYFRFKTLLSKTGRGTRIH